MAHICRVCQILTGSAAIEGNKEKVPTKEEHAKIHYQQLQYISNDNFPTMDKVILQCFGENGKLREKSNTRNNRVETGIKRKR